MKKTILTATMILSISVISALSAQAAIRSGTYKGELKSINGNEDGEVTVLIQAKPPTDPDVIYGVILNKKEQSGSIYRIEELADATQAWINLYQGKNNILVTNPNQVATLKATISFDGSLRLVPNDTSSICANTISKIEVKPSEETAWQDFSDNSFPNGTNGSKLELQQGQLSGSLVFSNASYSGSFALSKLAEGMASVRARVLSPNSLSGWALSREILGIAIAVKSRGGFWDSEYQALNFVKLPVNQEQCMNITTSVKTN